MTTRFQCGSHLLRVIFLLAVLCESNSFGDEPVEVVDSIQSTESTPTNKPERDGLWFIHRDQQTGIQIRTMEMTLHPKGEPRPALKYRLIADDFEMLDGNAAMYYLKAGGFFEQGPAHQRLREFKKKAYEEDKATNKYLGNIPPYSWLSMAPNELPLKEVKEYLALTSFQPYFLEQAAKRRRFELDRDIKNVKDPIAYLLPEIQSMRELGRTQTFRFKVAIAENRLDDAIAILGQQYALAAHLGQDDFIVTNLVGMAVAGIAWPDALTLAQHPNAPNMYWAYASLPRNLVDISHSMSIERQFLYLQVKALREVDETPRSVGYWSDFVDRVADQVASLSSDFGLRSDDPETNRSLFVGYIAASYPGAKRYLMEEYDFSAEKIEAYPIAQVVFLAMVRFYENARDDFFKWSKLPYWQARPILMRNQLQDALRAETKLVGFASKPAHLLLPAVVAVRTAVARTQQAIALLQTVEAIRMYGADHNGKLPQTLDELPVPAPMEPFTGKPLDYEYHRGFAVLNGHEMPGIRYRLILRFAEKD